MKFLIIGMCLLGSWIMLEESVKAWVLMFQVQRSENLRQGRIIALKKTGGGWMPRGGGDYTEYTFFVELEENGEQIRVPTTKKWNLTRHSRRFWKEKFRKEEGGRPVIFYYDKKRNIAILREQAAGSILANLCKTLMGIFVAGLAVFVFWKI